ncbi:MAG: hypothetical protein Q4F66_08400 [Clostridium sp.]|nr:hypothetical protein [Clostridium sp.]
MKSLKKLTCMLLTLAICMGINIKSASAEIFCIQSSYDNKFLIINGESIGLINHDATFVPLEPVAEYCNINLTAVGDKKYTFSKDGNNYSVGVGEPGYIKNGEMIYNSYVWYNWFDQYAGTGPYGIGYKKQPLDTCMNITDNGFLYVSLEFLYNELKVPFRIGVTGGSIILGNEYNAQGTITEMNHEYSVVKDAQIRLNKTINKDYDSDLNSDGKWEKTIENNWCFVLNNGKRVTGWNKINGEFYYLRNDGVMQSNKEIDGYRLGADGAVTNADYK